MTDVDNAPLRMSLRVQRTTHWCGIEKETNLDVDLGLLCIEAGRSYAIFAWVKNVEQMTDLNDWFELTKL